MARSKAKPSKTRPLAVRPRGAAPTRDADAKAILALQARMERDFTSIRDGLIAIGERLERKRQKLRGSAKKLAEWAESNCSMRRRQVFNYLKVYKHRAMLIEAGSGIASLRAALRMLNQAPERLEAAAETERAAALRRDALARWKEKKALKPAQRAALRDYWSHSIERLTQRIDRYRNELQALDGTGNRVGSRGEKVQKKTISS